ncbi:MAG: hypothetical protein ABSD20_18095, partial [Terriglobales bacterium]
FEVCDPATGNLLDGFFVVGWARRASDGLVGIARHDGEVGAAKVIEYLKTATAKEGLSPDQVQQRLEAKGIRVVSKSDLGLLGKVEAREAQARGLNYFKHSDDESMLKAIETERADAEKACSACAAAHD